MTTKIQDPTILHQTCRKEAEDAKKVSLIITAMNNQHLWVSLKIQDGIREFLSQTGSVVG